MADKFKGTVQSKNNAGARSWRIALIRTSKPPQQAKVLYFWGLPAITNFETQEVKNLYRKKLELLQASRTCKKLFVSVHLEKVCGVRSLFILTSFVSWIYSAHHSIGAKGTRNHARTHAKSCLKKQTPFSTFPTK